VKKRLLVPFWAVAALAMGGCAIIAPPKEDIAAVRAANEQLPVLLDKSAAVYKTTIDAYVAELNKWVDAAIENTLAYEMKNFPADADGKPHVVTGAEVLALQAKAKAVRATADKEIAALYAGAMGHEVHGQLHKVAKLLHDYESARMTRDEVQADLAKQAHDLAFSKKVVQ
jgi:hypothetical protein